MSPIPSLTSCILQLLRHFQAADTRAKQQVLNYYFFILVDFFSDILRWTFLTPKSFGILTSGLQTTRNELEVSIRFQIVLRFEGVWERQNGLETPLLVNVVFKAAAIGASTQNSSAAAEGWETCSPALQPFTGTEFQFQGRVSHFPLPLWITEPHLSLQVLLEGICINYYSSALNMVTAPVGSTVTIFSALLSHGGFYLIPKKTAFACDQLLRANLLSLPSPVLNMPSLFPCQWNSVLINRGQAGVIDIKF